jgi:hypothetical protein
MVLQTDVRNFSEVKSLVDKAVKHGGIDVLVIMPGLQRGVLLKHQKGF